MINKLLVILMSAFILGGCSGGTVKEDVLNSVKIAHPVRLGNETEKTFSGVVKEANGISLGFKVGGQISRIFVKEGDYIHQGQSIAQLDANDYKLNVEMMQVQYNQLKNEAARMEILFKEKSISGNDYEKVISQLNSLKAQLQMNKNKLEYTTLVSPVSGYVQSVNFKKAEMVDAGSSIINLIDMEYLEVECDIPASLYMKRDCIRKSYGSSSLLPKEQFALQLISIVPKADGNQLYRVKYLLEPSAKKKLTAGMNIDINISLTGEYSTGGQFTLPMKSVFNENGKSYVWLLKADSTVTKREVVLNGISQSGEAIVNAQLSETDNIVRAGVTSLNEKEKVRIISEPEKSNVGGLL